jgi:uncharacterized membrane protein YesL
VTVDGPRPLRDRLLGATYDTSSLVLVNVIWFVFTALIVTAFPALGGLYYATNAQAHGKPADWRLFMEGFRAYFWLSWRWGILNVAVVGVLVGNVLFYGQVTAEWAVVGRALAGALLALWTVLQMFAWPLLMEQEDRRVRVALRNSAVILIRQPVLSLSVAAALALVALASVLVIRPAVVFISASLIAYMGNKAVIRAIDRIAPRTSPPE